MPYVEEKTRKTTNIKISVIQQFLKVIQVRVARGLFPIYLHKITFKYE
jgi:hypothetical protein